MKLGATWIILLVVMMAATAAAVWYMTDPMKEGLGMVDGIGLTSPVMTSQGYRCPSGFRWSGHKEWSRQCSRNFQGGGTIGGQSRLKLKK